MAPVTTRSIAPAAIRWCSTAASPSLRRIRTPKPSTNLWSAIQGNLAQSVEEAERLLWQKTCKECHVLTYPAPDARPEILKSAIPVRWMTHAKFDHGAHQLVTCTECHAQAKTSNSTRTCLLPGIATCQKCHSGGRLPRIHAARSATIITTGRKPSPRPSVHTILDFVR